MEAVELGNIVNIINTLIEKKQALNSINFQLNGFINKKANKVAKIYAEDDKKITGCVRNNNAFFFEYNYSRPIYSYKHTRKIIADGRKLGLDFDCMPPLATVEFAQDMPGVTLIYQKDLS